jgi:hypothetical protein
MLSTAFHEPARGATMATGLFQILSPRRDKLSQAITRDLRASDLPHYGEIDINRLKQRVDRFVDAFIESTTGEPLAFVRFIERLAEERITEGYYLEEIQRVLSLLWEHAWKTVVESSPPDTLIQSLAFVSRTVGSSKDELARIYLARTQEVNTRAQMLEEKLKQLLGGDVPRLHDDEQ